MQKRRVREKRARNGLKVKKSFIHSWKFRKIKWENNLYIQNGTCLDACIWMTDSLLPM